MRVFKSLEIFFRTIKISNYGWVGDFPNWQQAAEQCTGYNASAILTKVTEATLKVIKGEVAYERDSILFDKIEYSWPLLAALLWVGNRNKGALNVMDFGGSLGSSYFQNRFFLNSLQLVRWNIVEQKNFVASGKAFVKDERVHFFDTTDDMLERMGKPDILLISCSLPYLERPYETLERLLKIEVPFILIDNTYFNYEERDRICIQKVSPAIYSASYPCWFLNYRKVLELVSKEYDIISEHKNDSFIFLNGRKVQYRGFLATIKNNC